MRIIKESNLKIHPRAIEAMGASLVTSDNVAMLELVKNAYDAFAYNVNVKICYDNQAIIITDDGLGMSQDIIEESWATISTKYKTENTLVTRDGKTRVVSGNKGLGRLSASRLGDKLTLITKKAGGPTLKTEFVWSKFYDKLSTDECVFSIYEIDDDADIKESGTKLIIEGLKSQWDEAKIDGVKIELQRLLNPFQKSDFNITLNDNTQPLTIFNFSDNTQVIEISGLINDPQYTIYGEVDENKNIHYTFKFVENYLSDDKRNIQTTKGVIPWEDIDEKGEEDDDDMLNQGDQRDVTCGKFSFEIRVWEQQSEYLDFLKEKYSLKKSAIAKKIIEQQKGISVYRDGVLVLPKSDQYKDWLGLDKRRISQIGRRLSTNQIIGQINITLKNNPMLIDTTNREAFIKNKEYDVFYTLIVKGIIDKLQKLRLFYKTEVVSRPRVNDFFQNASPKELRAAVEQAVSENKSAKEVQKVVDDFSNELEKNLEILKERVEYFAQLASAGTFSKVIIHEIKNNVNPTLRFNKEVIENFSPLNERMQRDYNLSNTGCKRLLGLSDAFSPLSRTTFKKEKHTCNLFSEVNNVGLLLSDYLNDNKIRYENLVDKGVNIKLHSGEIQTVLINLVDNAIYWICKNKGDNERIIRITSEIKDEFVEVKVSDSGVGVDPVYGEKIFLPGITSKPTGFGMGLVVVNEIIATHSGYLKNIQPGDIQHGATFAFTVPKE